MTDPNPPVRLRRDGIALSDLGDEVVILDLASSAYFSTSKVGAALVRWLHDGHSAAGLVDRIVTTYAVPRAVAETDVAEFLGQLDHRNLLEPAP